MAYLLFDFVLDRPVLALCGLSPIILVLLIIYLKGWPKPLPDIPYNQDGLGFFGDVPSLAGHVKTTGGEFWTWMAAQNTKHKSALVQVFMSPMHSRPALCLADAREAQDILLRRTDEFDRADMAKDFIRGIIPRGQITLSTDEVWKAHRALTKDLMTPAFLTTVSMPAVYERAIDLIELWKVKAELAEKKPFPAASDIHVCALDAIWDAAFGTEDGLAILRANRKYLQDLQSKAQKAQADGSVTFEAPPAPEIVQAVIDLDEATEYALQSTVPGPAWKIMSYLPWFKRAWQKKEDMLRSKIEKARDRVERHTAEEYQQRCALDNMVSRELVMAEKLGRPPNFESRDFYDELFGFILGGHDTTSTTTAWAVKYLGENPSAQTRFREALRTSIPAAVEEKRQPTAQEIANAKDPYIDAILEETMRHSQTLPGTTRQATRDTTLLGHHVPKGTEVYFLGNGADYFSPGFPIEEKLRSKTSQEAYIEGKSYGSWDPKDMDAFKPERWLATDESGKLIFNKMAGLHLTFGLGTRGCFGRRLAYIEMRLFLCLMIWTFVFEPITGELASNSFVDKLTRIPKQCYVKLSLVA